MVGKERLTHLGTGFLGWAKGQAGRYSFKTGLWEPGVEWGEDAQEG